MRMNVILKKAYEKRIPVEIIYISQDNKITQRTVFIEKITPSSIQTYCFLRQEQRKFIIDNILAVKLANKRFSHVS